MSNDISEKPSSLETELDNGNAAVVHLSSSKVLVCVS